MKAILYTQFGPPEDLQLREEKTPVPKDHEVLIRIHATVVKEDRIKNLPQCCTPIVNY